MSDVRLIFGCGYLGLRVARRWRDTGQRVIAITRSPERAERLAAEGVEPLVADVLDPATLTRLPLAATVLYAVGYDRAAGASRRTVYVGGLQSVLAALPAATGKLIYVSSTGVYGPSDDDWVDELTPCRPEREGGQACLEAEGLLAAHPLGQHSVVLRMAGLYGPDRLPNAADLRLGRPLAAPEHGYLNLIHVDDAASVVLAAEARAPLPSLFVASDGNPVLRREYYAELARRLDAPSPQYASPTSDSPATARASASKRVRNTRLVQQLAVRFDYPSYREGLAAIVAGQGHSQG
jgi:nucleoside-diphosphate-sugar epimerase